MQEPLSNYLAGESAFGNRAYLAGETAKYSTIRFLGRASAGWAAAAVWFWDTGAPNASWIPVQACPNGLSGSAPLPRNTLPMMMGQGPFGLLEMGGMFTTVKVRDDLAAGDYRDPGWYKHPPGTVAWKASPEELARLLG